ALDFTEPVFGDELFDRLGQAFERARGILVGAGLERVLTLEFKQRPYLGEDLRHAVFVHAANMNLPLKSSKLKVIGTCAPKRALPFAATGVILAPGSSGDAKHAQ